MSTPEPPGPPLPRHGPWQIRVSHQVYSDPWVEVRQDEVIRPDGRDGRHVVVSPTRLYLARRLRFVATAPEGTEQIRCVKLPLAEAYRLVAASRITHGPSCVLILRAYLERGGAMPSG